ncbi:MAG: DUF2252 family protein [Myxococcota bacterium]|nr:DUF2252 family protein [Myxococcota bacterium]
MLRLSVICIVLAGVAGCRDSPRPLCDDAFSQSRYTQILGFIQQDNAVWMTGRLDLIRAKLCKMAGRTPACLAFGEETGFLDDIPEGHDAYNFMRGAVGLFYADVARIGRYPRFPTDMLSDPNATKVLLVVDPHPENLSTAFRRAVDTRGTVLIEDLTMEWFDFDASQYGPYTLDLRRAALGLAAFGSSISACAASCRHQITDAMTRTYIDTLRQFAAEQNPPPPHPGRLIEDLVNKAIRDGAIREKLVENTVGTSGYQRLKVGERHLDGLVAPTAAEWTDIRHLAERYRAGRLGDDLELLDAARRFGQGVSSLPAPRYIMLWRRRLGPNQTDVFMLNVRLVLDPPRIPDVTLRQNGLFTSNAERIATISTRLWSTPHADPNFGVMTLGNSTYKAMTWSSYYKELGHDKLQKAFNRGATTDDLVAVGRWVGYTLASAHSNGKRADGGYSLPSLVNDIAGREARLVDEIRSTQNDDYQTLIADHRIFQCILENEGLLAGLDRIEMDLTP